MAHLLGFDPRPVEDKYDTEDELAELETAAENLRNLLKLNVGEADRVRGAFQILTQEIEASEERIRRFSYSKINAGLTKGW